MFQRKPTRVQVGMIALIAIAFFALLGFAVPEVAGILSPGEEDTFSEFIWDLPLWAVVAVSTVFAVVALIAAWASIHFFEGWVARRKKEKSASKR